MPRAPYQFILFLICSYSFLACGGPTDPATAAAEGNIKALEEMLTAPDLQTRTKTLDAINGIATENKDAQSLLIEASQSAYEDVWKKAIEIFLDRALSGETWAVEAYKKHALSAPRAVVKVAAVRLVQQKGEKAPKLFLEEIGALLSDRDALVVQATIDALKAMGDDAWPVIKQTLENPLPTIRAKAAQAALEFPSIDKHLDEIVDRYLIEDDKETVRPLLEEILVKNGRNSLVPLVNGLAEIEDADKRKEGFDLVIFLDPKNGGIARYIDEEEKNEKKKVKWRCNEILAATEQVLSLSKNAKKLIELETPGFWVGVCFGRDYKKAENREEAKTFLENTLKEVGNPSMTRQFALSILCEYPGSPGFDRALKRWAKTASRKDKDRPVRSLLRKNGRC